MKYVFIHGGPGLNSYADKVTVGDKLAQAGFDFIFWNEPKGSSYEGIVKDLKATVLNAGPTILVGHSFGAYLVNEILQENPNNVKGAVLLSPAVNLEKSNHTIIQLAGGILSETQPKLAESLNNLRVNLGSKFDSLMGEALLIAFQSGYFIKNFIDPKKFENYFNHLAGENEFRVEDFIRIRQEEDRIDRNPRANTTQCLAIIGSEDPVFSVESESSTLDQMFSNLAIEKWGDQSHYPHIEDTDRFIETLRNFTEKVSG